VETAAPVERHRNDDVHPGEIAGIAFRQQLAEMAAEIVEAAELETADDGGERLFIAPQREEALVGRRLVAARLAAPAGG
jgi:hypothetical protein